jgi:hypothetical protein
VHFKYCLNFEVDKKLKLYRTTHCYGIFSNVTATRWELLLLLSLLLLLVGLPAKAATDFHFSPTGQLPAGCSLNSSSNSSYTCGVVTLVKEDTITVGSVTPVTITFTGAFTTAIGNFINISGATTDLNIVTNSVITLAADTVLNANVTSNNLINMGVGSSISGNVTASTSAGVVNLPANSTVGGFIHTDSGAVNVGESSIVDGGISTSDGVVTLKTNTSVRGNISTTKGAVNVGDLSTIDGGITTTEGVVTLEENVKVGGDINTTAGAVNVGDSSTIDGDISTTKGVVELNENINIGGSVTTIAGDIAIGSGSSICDNVASTGTGVITVNKNIQIGGDIKNDVGAITVGGDIMITGAGVVTLNGNLFGGNISTINSDVNLKDSRVRGNATTTGTGNISLTNSVINDSTLAVPVASNCSVASAFDHIEIVHDGHGLTCSEENVTVKACADATCSSLFSELIDVELSINGVLDQTVTVSGGSTVANFSYTNTGTAKLSADHTFICHNNGSASCDVLFADAGFRFLYGAAETTSLGHQTSGNNFTDIIKLQAVENVNGVCTGLFAGDVDVELSQQNITPSGTTGLSFRVNGTSGTSIGKYPSYTPTVTLDFGENSKATIPTPVYLDAGQIRLHARYNVDDISLFGDSTDFWVSPAKLFVTATSDGNDINGNSNSSVIKHKAGQAFDFTVTAYNSLGTEAGNLTTNYVPNEVQLLLTRTGPATGGINGIFDYGNGTVLSDLTPIYQGVTLTAFKSGMSFTNSALYSEVGLLNLDLQDVNYGFSGNVITADAINIGRFTPEYFEQTVVEHGSFDTVCFQNTAFAYIGQVMASDAGKGAITYLSNPVVELTAKNGQGVTTQNYTASGYNKLIAASNFIVTPTTDSTILGNDTNFLPLTANLLTGTLSHAGLVANDPGFGLPLGAGTLHYELADDDNFFYPRNENSEVAAQDNDIDFLIDQVNFVDSDGIAITLPENITSTASINIRFGRVFIENSFGPETEDFRQHLLAQYLNANGRYVDNKQDSCTKYDTGNIILTSGTLSKDLIVVEPVSGHFEDGETRIMVLTAPGLGNQGTIHVEYDIFPWLEYDWSWNGVDAKLYSENPSATATFGLFRGNDRVIQIREIYD